MTATFHCADCKQDKPEQKEGGTGYAVIGSARICYACCAFRDRETMRSTGKAALYLVKNDGKHEVTNWPGTLRLRVGSVKRGRHNIARARYDFWFAFEGRLWHGVTIGDSTQIAHCKRTREAA
jgi:hypothetical protein